MIFDNNEREWTELKAAFAEARAPYSQIPSWEKLVELTKEYAIRHDVGYEVVVDRLWRTSTEE
jgi:hypothetical protein